MDRRASAAPAFGAPIIGSAPALVALLLHVALLVPIRWTWPDDTSPRPAVQVRIVGTSGELQTQTQTQVQVQAQQPGPAQGFPELGSEAGAHGPMSAQRPVRAPSPVERVARPSSPSPPLRPRSLIDESSRAAAVALAPPLDGGRPAEVVTRYSPQAEATIDPTAAPPPDEAIPIYRTRVPPSVSLHYAMRRGSQLGTGDLQWRTDGAGYTLAFVGSVAGASVLTQASRGAFDAAGLAPERYTDRRSKRLLATNFRRDAGRISFSGESGSQPLVPGSQDRLSWLMQLAAVLSAEPERGRPGEAISMAIAGVRGEPAIWTFVSMGLDAAANDAAAPASLDTTPAASRPDSTPDPVPYRSALKFLRESRGPYDTEVEVWLDPARHHLPVRVRFTGAAEAQTLELILERLDFAP